MNWAAGLRATMSTEEKVRDAASAQTLKAEHEALKGEIEAREDSFSSVLDLGEAMVQTGHYAATVSQKSFSKISMSLARVSANNDDIFLRKLKRNAISYWKNDRNCIPLGNRKKYTWIN